jgi:uncharacterized OB-fold protein
LPQEERAIPTVTFQRYLESGELSFQHCRSCSAAVFYPRVLCPYCGSEDLEWRESKGAGTVYTTTMIYRRNETYNVSLIDLDEGFRMMSRVEDTPQDEVQIGTRVSFEVRRSGEDHSPVAVFVPMEVRA